MNGLDQASIEKILFDLEEKNAFHGKYKFCKHDNKMQLLGTGSFSSVYEMYDVDNEKMHYALKVMGFGKSSLSSKLILGAAQLQYNLSMQSQHILRIIEVLFYKLEIDENGKLLSVITQDSSEYDESDAIEVQFILMEKLEDIVKKDRFGNIEASRPDLKTEEGIINFAKEVGSAILTVHNNSILHRDIKLENIFWDERNEKYKLGDFGIAKYVDNGNAETVVFTDGYGAPEIERRLKESYNATADIYSFGVTLYLLLNDFRFPVSDTYRANIVQYDKDFIFPAPVNASAKLASIIRKMCSYNPAERYQSIEEVLIELSRLDGTYSMEDFKEDFEELITETFREDILENHDIFENHNLFENEIEEDYLDDETVSFETVDFETKDNKVEGCEPENSGEDSKKIDIEVTFKNEAKTKKQNLSKSPESNREEDKLAWLDRDRDEMTYEQRKRFDATVESIFLEAKFKKTILLGILIALLFPAFSVNTQVVGTLSFWILPIIMLGEALLQREREFNYIFEALLIGLIIFDLVTMGLNMPLIIILVLLFTGILGITAGCGLGMVLWIYLVLWNKAGWLDIFSKWDMGWLVIIAIFAMAVWICYSNAYWVQSDMDQSMRCIIVSSYLAYVMVGIGIVLLVLERLGTTVEVAETLQKIHFIRVGIAMYIVHVMFYHIYGLNKNEEDFDKEWQENHRQLKNK